LVNIVLTLGTLAVPFFFKLIVDQVAELFKTHNTALMRTQMWHILLILLAIQLLISVLGYYQQYLRDTLRLDTFFGLRKAMMEQSMRLSLDYYEANQAGAISDKMTQGVYEFGEWFDQLMDTALSQIFMVILAVAIITIRSPLAGLISVL